MSAQKQDDWFSVRRFVLHLGERAKALPCKSFGKQGQEIWNLGTTGELVVRRMQEALDGFDAEDAVEVLK